MDVIASATAMQQRALAWRTAGDTIAFVPTMGALHEGHAELIRRGRASASKLIVSIFVNPTQFGPNEDLAKYPPMLEKDLECCRRCEVDAVLTPIPDDIYPQGYQTFVEVGQLSQGLCGPHRPGHFRGVATVVLKLFQIVQPHIALFGEKDYQQLQVIRQMVHDVMCPVAIIPIPTVREADGLALSSRNQYLSATERAQALAIPRALFAAQAHATQTRDPAALCDFVRDQFRGASITRIDYIAIVDADSLAPLATLDRPARLCIAAYVGATRMIDNVAVD